MSTGKHGLITTLDDLLALDETEMVEGYLSAERGDPEPGTNHSLAYCHGWRSRQYDYGTIPIPPEHRALAYDYLNHLRGRSRAKPIPNPPDQEKSK